MLIEPIASAVDTILIVDDDTARAARIGQVLSLHGYGVLHACGDHAAIDLAREHRPPLVLLSVTTARGELADLCRRLQSDWRCGSPSIIVLAGRAEVVDFASGLVNTADDYVILEPFDAVRVLTRVGATLRRAEEMRASSPLTGLPGNTAIETELQRRTALSEPMALLYVDLDNFKAYNDHYGFLRGDAVIRGMADVLRTAAEKRPGTFLGHVGGDDFVVVSAPEEAEDIANEVIAHFDERAPSFYDPEDAARGEIEVVDRQGNPHSYPFVTVSIGISRTLDGQIGDHRALVDIATEMKQVAKNEDGSAAAMDRRMDYDRGITPRPSLQRGRELPRLAPGRLPGRRPHRQSRGRRLGTLMSALLLLPTLMMGPAVAENAAPGEPLYGAKLTLESARVTLATSPLHEVALHLEFASRRLDELTQLLDEPDPESRLVGIVSENFREHVQKARQRLLVLKDRGETEGPRAAKLKTKVFSTAVLSETVRLQCGQPEVPVAATRACEEIQLALTTVHEFPELVVPDSRERILIASPLPPAPPNSAPPNTTTATAGQPPASPQTGASSQAGAEPGATRSKERSSGEDTAAKSDDVAAKPAQPATAEAAASPEPEPTSPEPSPSPTATPTENPPPPTHEQQQQEYSAPPGQPDGASLKAGSRSPEPPDPTPDPEPE